MDGKGNKEFKETGRLSDPNKPNKPDLTLTGTKAYKQYRERRTRQEVWEERDKSGSMKYQGIFEDSNLIIPSGSGITWKTKKICEDIKDIQKKIAEDSGTGINYPIEHAHHILPRFRLNNLVYSCSPAQRAELGKILGIKNFATMSPVQQVQELCSLPSNVFLGPSEHDRADSTQSHKSERLYIKKQKTNTSIIDIRTSILANIEHIMMEQGKILKEYKKNTIDEFTFEEFKMICLCFEAVNELHGELCGKGKLDAHYASFRERNTDIDKRWILVPKVVGEHVYDKQITAGNMGFMKYITDIKTENEKSTANHFLQLNGNFSNFFVKSIRQHGRLSDQQINKWTNAIVDRFKELKSMSRFPEECSNIVQSMRKYMQRNNFKDIANVQDEDVVCQYTQAYLKRFKKIDPRALADAFVGWDAKYNMWVEDSLVRSEGYSPEDANKIVNAIGEKVNSDPEELAKLKMAIKKYRGKEPERPSEYARSYVHMFTKMKSTDKLYIQAATEFFETGTLPLEITQEEADQLAKTISIRADILNAIGWRYQKDPVSNREKEIARTGKKSGEFVQNALQERTKIEGMDITYGKVASNFFETGTFPSVIPSQEVANQLAKAIKIMSGMLKAGTASQREQINKREKEIARTGKKPGEFVQNALQERILPNREIAGTQITYGQVFSELCQHGHILPNTRSMLCPNEQPLSKTEIDQIKEAIRLQVHYSRKHEELKQAFINHTKQDQKTLPDYVEDCLNELRSWWFS